MGEAFRRARAAAFKHQRSGPYQNLVNANLRTLTRETMTSHGIGARLSNTTTGLTVGTACLITPTATGGQYQVIYGNRVVGILPPEAATILRNFERIAPALNGMFPCRIVGESGFGGVTLELDPANDSDG